MSKQNWRIGVTILMVILACIAFWDTVKLWTLGDEAQAQMQENDPGELLKIQQDAIHLGLDLQGGIHVVLRVKLEEIDQGSRGDAVDRAMQIIRNRVDGLGVAEPTIVKQGNDLVEGAKITLFLKENRSIVEGGQGSKVKAVISPRSPDR